MATCRFCNEGNLWWDRTTGKWRLMTQDDKLHTCLKLTPAIEAKKHRKRLIREYCGVCPPFANAEPLDVRDMLEEAHGIKVTKDTVKNDLHELADELYAASPLYFTDTLSEILRRERQQAIDKPSYRRGYYDRLLCDSVCPPSLTYLNHLRRELMDHGICPSDKLLKRCLSTLDDEWEITEVWRNDYDEMRRDDYSVKEKC